jgi:hypothetical protein
MAERLRLARLAALATGIRLRTPEAFATHQKIIDWRVTLSATKLPAASLGLSRPTLWAMRWALERWERMQLLNRAGGTLGAAIQMDFIPMLLSATAFSLRYATPAEGDRPVADVLQAGVHTQRFWLTATRLGLAVHPSMAILVFSDYGEKKVPFTAQGKLRLKAGRLADRFLTFFGAGTRDFVFMGRIGEPLPRMSACRSVRRTVAELMIPSSGEQGRGGGSHHHEDFEFGRVAENRAVMAADRGQDAG